MFITVYLFLDFFMNIFCQNKESDPDPVLFIRIRQRSEYSHCSPQILDPPLPWIPLLYL